MGEIRSQVDQALAGAGFLDPESPDHAQLHYDADEQIAMKGAVSGLITALRILADHLDAR